MYVCVFVCMYGLMDVRTLILVRMYVCTKLSMYACMCAYVGVGLCILTTAMAQMVHSQISPPTSLALIINLVPVTFTHARD